MFIPQGGLHPFTFEGLGIVDYTAGRPTASSFAIIDVPPGVGHRPARSKRSEKLYYVLTGETSFEIAGRSQTLCAGDACVVPVGVIFSYRNTGTHPARLALVHTPPFRLDDEEFVS